MRPKIWKVFENCYVELEKRFKTDLFAKAVQLSPKGTLTSLSKVINEGFHTISDSKTRTPIKLSLVIKLSKFLVSGGYKEFSLKEIERHVEYIKGMGCGTKIHKPKIPFNFATSAGVRIISRMYHDGGIGADREPHYHNQNIDLIEEFCEDVRDVFGEMEIKIRESDRKLTVQLPHLIGDILEIAGCFLGTKVDNSVALPLWIKHLDERLISEFLRVSMDDEGTFGTRCITLSLANDISRFLSPKLKIKLISSSKSERIKVLRKYLKHNKNYVSNILLFNQLLLHKIGIKTTGPRLKSCYTDKNLEYLRTVWTIQISSRENIERYQRLVGFKSLHKDEKLKAYIEGTSRFIKGNENSYAIV